MLSACATDPASFKTTKGATPLHALTVCGHESVIQKLANPADGSVKRRQDSLGKTPWVT